MMIFNALTSMERIETYLEKPELERFTTSSLVDQEMNETTIGFEDASFQYPESTEGFTLKDLNVKFESGKLHLITGPTGGGKSSIFMALLGEMSCISGRYWMPQNKPNKFIDSTKGLNQTIAYAAQTPWLLNATIRDNIIFGQEFDLERYMKVIKACALILDFNVLKGGDLTEIGEKGINLSGGQKQRIALARVCYSKAKIVLLDHPFSAVDAPTGRILFERALIGLLKGRTVLISSHNESLIAPFADKVYNVQNGTIQFFGSHKPSPQKSIFEGSEDVGISDSVLTDIEDAFKLTNIGEGTQLIQAEQKATGRLDWSVYMLYLTACGGIGFFMMFILSFIFVSGCKVLNTWWLKVWTDHNSEIKHNMFFTIMNATNNLLVYITTDDDQVYFYVKIYSFFGLLVIVASTLQYLVFIAGSYRGSVEIHRRLLDRILGAPLRFFDVTPIGRILNRFSNDMEQIDTRVMDSVQSFLTSTFQAFTVVFVIGYISPIFFLIFPFVAGVYIYLAKIYMTTSRELKRYESINRSPIFTLFSETLTGIITIRAFGHEERFINLNLKQIDNNVRPRVFWILSNRWLSFRIDLISSFIVFCAGLVVAWGDFTSGLAGLTISFSLQMSSALLDAIRDQADLELILNSVERAKEYLEIDQEPPHQIPETKPDDSWPQYGSIKVDNLGIKYSKELPFVLKNVSFSVNPGEKLAIVGRTGAGKSTLSLAFFRIIPLLEGTIVIDGIDIRSLGLYDLRSRLSIITQDPVLFTGTLRSNMDPLEESSDEKVWDALNRVKFIESFQTNEGQENTTINLDYGISEGGANLSQGQRQLLCLARSLLQRKRVILLDEATSSVDSLTDGRIQSAIRNEFAESTILTIAHRLSTIIDYDKVLVLDNGKVVEFGTPLELMNLRGIFDNMCQETGEYESLSKIASK
jgi:ABC-type multidrug transport system fused ATPase/permease subunit